MRRPWDLQPVQGTARPAPGPAEVIDSFVGPYGLYVHVPFCRSICPYCPYNKVLFRSTLASRYFGALRSELGLYEAGRRRFTSLYIGGGTPSLCVEQLAHTLVGIEIERERAIEVFPSHATPDTLAQLEAMGITHVSLGIQSFDPRFLRHLGRLNTVEENRRALELTVGRFACVNADLIFDVAFADPAAFLRDFEACCRAGVDQISSYPLMHFGFTPLGKAPHGRRTEHELLRQVEEIAQRLGYERRSVWTFNRVGSPLYASIAREFYLGCGAGAASFTGRDFLVNHFGVEQYASALADGRLPIARVARLGSRRAALYYAFWQLYAPGLDLERLERFFPDAGVIGAACRLLRRTGQLASDGRRLRLTPRGYDHYHDLERVVTYRLIEPLWEELLLEHRSAGATTVSTSSRGKERPSRTGRARVPTRRSRGSTRQRRSVSAPPPAENVPHR